MICKNCSQHVTEGASFCPSCGAPINEDTYERPSKVKQASPAGQGGYSKYIFVVSLILMIIFILNVFTSFNSLESFNELLIENANFLTTTELGLFNKMIGLVQGEAALIFINFALSLALMIVASMLKNKMKRNEESPISLLKAQFILSIGASVSSVVYVIYEIIALSQLSKIALELESFVVTTSYTSLIFPIAIAGLLIPCIFKSLSLLKKS